MASGIFTNFLNRYWTDVLFVNYKTNGVLPSTITTFLTLLPLLSAILIVVGNLVAGQIIERTHTKAGKARPWILLSSVLLGISCIFMFIVPMGNGTDSPVLTMVLTAIAYNLYYSVCYPLYNTANSTLIPVSTQSSCFFYQFCFRWCNGGRWHGFPLDCIVFSRRLANAR